MFLISGRVQMNLSDMIGVTGVIVTAASVVITALALYFTDTANFRGIVSDKYKGLYGNYKMFNYSRERTGRFVEWDVQIKKRFLKTPRFIARYTAIENQHTHYSGSLILNHGNMIIFARGLHAGRDDFEVMVFNGPHQNRIVVEVGFLCGFQQPPNPYCGVHILCSQDWSAEDIKSIFDNSKEQYGISYGYFEDRATKLVESRTPPVSVIRPA